MYFAYVYDYSNELYRSPTFDSFDKLTDYAADLVANDENAKSMEVYQDGAYRGGMDFDEQRDRALLDGYELPIHKKMLEREGLA